MKKAKIYCNQRLAGYLIEEIPNKKYQIDYIDTYSGPPISLVIPVQQDPHTFDSFPPFFEGVLPEGLQLEGLLKSQKLDRDDLWGQLMKVGSELVGTVTVEELL